MSNRSKRYTEEFKKQIVVLVKSGKSPTEIVKEYNVARSTVNKWVKDYTTSGSFKAKDNRTKEENELIKLRKENQRLKMENDILKQAALIMVRK
ncbi:transposase [Paramaledivibacter caminithermalis DSM 15212]|uniref:Transposase n=1 Tax=Paramaledivibacter caminithermalis (strain DSM 15212 / CIP 107654 / DViRD3) TaxID=1121301 RepID=A0A1M6TJA1_PARC5|nr:transposase [Paramaledivibacter caminithermalis DSM 15212]